MLVRVKKIRTSNVQPVFTGTFHGDSMKPSTMIKTISLLTVLSLFASPALAAYSQQASTFSAAGGESASGTYSNLGVIAQPGIVGSSTSTSYTADHGFLPVLGGWKILYPVISATPGTLSFSLVTDTSSENTMPPSNGQFTISNAGGSTLNWTITQEAGDTIFSVVSPVSKTGTNTGIITISANAAGLVPSPTPYSKILTISGAGIAETVTVQLDLTVSASPALYTLAITLKQAIPGKGGGNITMAVLPDLAVKSCSHLDTSCSYDFPPNSTVTLTQFPGSDSQMGSWSPIGCDKNETCQVVLNTPPGAGTEITFPYSFMTRVDSNHLFDSDSFISAYGSAATSDTINAREFTFVEGAPGSDVILSAGKTIKLIGGLDAYYAATGGFSTIQNVLKIRSGKLTVKGVKVRP